MYQALYRKWRPAVFDDVVGQEHITETLKRQIQTGKYSHAYLFTGTRGTGKTTCAKILAKAVNCESPVNGNPCCKCPSCLGIASGSILDVEELDAASNNGVDNIRALRDEAIYTPASVKKRVYIVDEVHMLSISAFNALLKILEEPPEHLIFILATTELHKVPATILSRCQRYSFKRIDPSKISARLMYIAKNENIELTEDAAALLARLADGSMRDALSLLDQCLSGGTVDSARVISAIGLAGSLDTCRLLEAIGKGNVSGALEIVDALYRGGKDIGAVLDELNTLQRDILIAKIAGRDGAGLLSGSFDNESLKNVGSLFSDQRLISGISAVSDCLADFRNSGSRTSAEICIIKMCDISLDSSVAALSARISDLESRISSGIQVSQPAQSKKAEETPVQQAAFTSASSPADDIPPWEEAPVISQPEQVKDSAPQSVPAAVQENGVTENIQPESAHIDGPDNFWSELLGIIKPQMEGSLYGMISNDSVSAEVSENNIHIYIKNDFLKGMLSNGNTISLLQSAAAEIFGKSMVIDIRGAKPETENKLDKLDRLRKFDNFKFE